jgi:hypothetical protein
MDAVCRKARPPKMGQPDIPVVRFTEVFRQAATSKIITSAYLIRQGKMPTCGRRFAVEVSPSLESASDLYFVEREALVLIRYYGPHSVIMRS